MSKKMGGLSLGRRIVQQIARREPVHLQSPPQSAQLADHRGHRPADRLRVPRIQPSAAEAYRTLIKQV